MLALSKLRSYSKLVRMVTAKKKTMHKKLSKKKVTERMRRAKLMNSSNSSQSLPASAQKDSKHLVLRFHSKILN